MRIFSKATPSAAALVAALAALPAMAAPISPAAPSHRYDLLGESIGLSGYDPVSYFPEGGGRPEKGLISISQQHDGVTYRFSSKEHLALFDKQPEKYLPAYGGWCAWAVAELGQRVDVDPESFQIRDAKLYLFYRDPALDTRSLWLKDVETMISKGNAHWPDVSR
jgi:hypothetical protein